MESVPATCSASAQDLLHRSALPHDVRMLNKESDLLPQIDILAFKPLFERFNLPKALQELILHSFAFGVGLLAGERVGKHLRDKHELLNDCFRPVSLLVRDGEAQQAEYRPFSNR